MLGNSKEPPRVNKVEWEESEKPRNQGCDIVYNSDDNIFIDRLTMHFLGKHITRTIKSLTYCNTNSIKS